MYTWQSLLHRIFRLRSPQHKRRVADLKEEVGGRSTASGSVSGRNVNEARIDVKSSADGDPWERKEKTRADDQFKRGVWKIPEGSATCSNELSKRGSWRIPGSRDS